MTEFNTWLPLDTDENELKSGEVRPRTFSIYVLNDSRVTISERSEVIVKWAENGGTLLIGYEMFGQLAKKELPEMHKALIYPGADLIVCDEGHRIKNSKAEISVALSEIRSKRRIVLTGFPLQNNVMEYYCMVDFAKPNYLGTKSEFAYIFQIPIQNGKYSDSTIEDIKLMNYRSYVLHTILRPIVQRRSNAVVENSLPQKQEYVIPLRMTVLQKDLYTAFGTEIRSKSIRNLLTVFAVASKIWNHPDILYNYVNERHNNMDLEIDELNKECVTVRGDEMQCNWAVELLKNFEPDIMQNSPKMEVFCCILEESLRVGDKLLLFSQSLLTLNLIEKFLQLNIEITWRKNCNYYHGSTSSKQREILINSFDSNPNVHLFLISTRAGSMGINLAGANRVIIFDSSWNPCHDNQALYRVHRYNQTKACFIYRLVMDFSLEMSIYLRQINKEAISARVVDHRNPDFISSQKELRALYWCDQNANFIERNTKYDDIVIEKIIEKLSCNISKQPFEHNSFLIDRAENQLLISEKRLAIRDYQSTKAKVHPKPSCSLVPDITTTPQWILEEKWQQQGINTKVVHLHEDATVLTKSGNVINLRQAQRVMKLKTRDNKHYIQLETGKIYPVDQNCDVGGNPDVGENPDATNRDVGDSPDVGENPDNISESTAEVPKGNVM